MVGGENSRGFCYDLAPGGDGPTGHGKRRLIRGEGFASRVSGNVRPQDPGGGTMPIVAPRQMTNNDASMRPLLEALQDGSVHVKIKRSGHWLA